MKIFVISLLVYTVFAEDQQERYKMFRPCFERYPNTRLVETKPYHSEWRMRSEEHCLHFCAQTASRCEALVWDSVQHICHFFLENGDGKAFDAPRMNLLRVTSKECLASTISHMNVAEVTMKVMDRNTPAPTRTVPPQIKQTSNTHGSNKIIPETSELLKEVHLEAPSTSSKSLQELPDENFEEFEPVPEYMEENNEVQKDIADMDDKRNRWQSSMEQLSKNNEHLTLKVFHHQTHGVPMHEEKKVETAQNQKSQKDDLKKKLQNKLDKLKENYPERFEALLASGDIQVTSHRKAETTLAPVVDSDAEMIEEAPLPISTTPSDPETEPDTPPSFPIKAVPLKKNKNWGAQKIRFREEMGLPHRKATGDLRRKPNGPNKNLEQVRLVEKAQSFLAAINADVDDTATVNPVTTNGCSAGESSVWMSIDNSMTSLPIDSSQVPDAEACRNLCKEMDCTSYTWFNKNKECQINQGVDGVHLQDPYTGVEASTTTKFCYSEAMSSFTDCSDFIAFRDFTLEIAPQEEFEGLPSGHEGLQYCIELCVLATEYECKSASFVIEEGKCILSSEDSLTQPGKFRPSMASGQIYFENGCTSTGDITYQEKEAAMAKRVDNQEKHVLKSLQIKTIKNRPRRSITQWVSSFFV